MLIRKAMEGDINAIKTIADSNKQAIGFVNRTTLQEAITRGWLLVAEQDGRVIGFANYRHCQRKPQTTLYEICVDNQYRGQGIGRALIEMLLQETMHKIVLKTPVEVAANGFYQRLGFSLARVESGKKRALNVWIKG